jgi:DNA-3-methyladenine glycosylase
LTKPLAPEFFARPTLDVAAELIGKLLVHEIGPGACISGRIVETEAYLQDDPACHGWGVVDQRTGRIQSHRRGAMLFGSPGTAYVYLNYGMYWLLNVITEPEGTAGAVLLRAAEPLSGIEFMRERRPMVAKDHQLTSGPGRLTLAFGVDGTFNGLPLTAPPLYLAEDDAKMQAMPVARSSRIGITKAVEHHWRFFVPGNPYVSSGKPSDRINNRRKPEETSHY